MVDGVKKLSLGLQISDATREKLLVNIELNSINKINNSMLSGAFFAEAIPTMEQ